jgi:hypothetical protein
MGRVDYYHDANAPKANSLVPGASAIVTDNQGRILLQRRSDNARWARSCPTAGVNDDGRRFPSRPASLRRRTHARVCTSIAHRADP